MVIIIVGVIVAASAIIAIVYSDETRLSSHPAISTPNEVDNEVTNPQAATPAPNQGNNYTNVIPKQAYDPLPYPWWLVIDIWLMGGNELNEAPRGFLIAKNGFDIYVICCLFK